MDDRRVWKKNNQLEEQSFRSKRTEQVPEKGKVPGGRGRPPWSTEPWTDKGSEVVDLVSPVLLDSLSLGIR